MVCLLGGWSGRLVHQLDSSIAISCQSRGGTSGTLCAVGGTRDRGSCLGVPVPCPLLEQSSSVCTSVKPSTETNDKLVSCVE